jgi:hypothetical protein
VSKGGNLPSWARDTPPAGTSAGSKADLPSWATSGTPATGKPQGKHGGGGFLHGLEHVAGQTMKDLYDTAVHSPSGVYQLGKAVAKASAGQPQDLEHIAVATGKGFVEDFKHPLRHPGNTLLDVGSVLSLGAGTAARVGEVGRVLKAGESGVGRAALKGPKPQARDIKYGDTSISAGTYSRSALKRSSQKLFDQLQQRFPDTHLPLRNLHERVGHELGTDRRIVDAIGRAPAHALAKIKLPLAKQKALQVVAEGVPVADRIRFHEGALPHLTGKLAASTRKEIAALKASAQYVHDVSGMPRIRPEHADLAEIYQKAHAVATKREELLGVTPKLARDASGKVIREQALADESAANRITGPGHVINPEHHFDPNLVPELFRVPHASRKALPALGQMSGYKGGIGKTPGSLKKTEYALLKSGAFRNDTTKLVAESYLEAHRFSALMKHRDEFLQLAHDTKQSEHDIPIRTDALLNRPWPKVLNDLSEKPALSKGDIRALGTHYEDARNDVFPAESIVKLEEGLLGEGKHPQVQWIDSRVLGGLNEANPIIAWPKKGVTVFDGINNASRAAILYLKPAYAVPNILGNAALNIVQQGWGAPTQVGRSARLWAKLDKETRAVVRQAMGEGVTGSLHTEAGVGTKAINKMAELWSGPVDTPFRVNAFFYEARRFGYKTPAQIRKLMGDEKELLKVAREANSEIIDYGRMGRFEQGIIRRVIFFYPWVKGSSVYAARFITTHPQQAALAGQLGKQGAAQDAKDLGALPSYAEGLFKVGQRGGNPLVVNPSSAGVLQTPADLLKMVQELGNGHPGQAFNMGQNFTPALQAALTILTHSGARKNESSLAAAERQLVAGLPAVTTAQGIMHPPADSGHPRVYPRTARDVLLHYLVGGLAPTPLNLSKAHAAKYLEDHPR